MMSGSLILKMIQGKMFSVPAVFPDNSEDIVWFWNKDGKLHIDGGGIEAEVVEANVGASNGVIHSINRVS